MLQTMLLLQSYQLLMMITKFTQLLFTLILFTAADLNYNIHDKELLTIFEAFNIWQYYLEGPAYPINVVTDHKNLEYFFTTKILI